jgi:hypothetical protein
MKTIKKESGEQRTQVAIWIGAVLFRKLEDFAHKANIYKRDVVVAALERFLEK